MPRNPWNWQSPGVKSAQRRWGREQARQPKDPKLEVLATSVLLGAVFAVACALSEGMSVC